MRSNTIYRYIGSSTRIHTWVKKKGIFLRIACKFSFSRFFNRIIILSPNADLCFTLRPTWCILWLHFQLIYMHFTWWELLRQWFGSSTFIISDAIFLKHVFKSEFNFLLDSKVVFKSILRLGGRPQIIKQSDINLQPHNIVLPVKFILERGLS